MLNFDVKAISDAFGIDEDAVAEYFSDGRKVSFIIENRIVKDITGGKRADSEGSPWDIEDRYGLKWEVRSLTKSGMYFCPSSMIGSGRSFEEQGFLNKLNNIEGYLIADITQFPNIPVYRVSADKVLGWYNDNKLGKDTKTSMKNVNKLIVNNTEKENNLPKRFRDVANAEQRARR